MPDLLPPNTTLVELRIPGRAVPWTPSRVLKSGRTYKVEELSEWQARVKDWASREWGQRHPYEGPISLQLWFYVTRGVRGQIPDTSNMTKSTEDAIQGVVIKNDRQTVKVFAERIVGSVDLTMVRVVAV